MKSIKSILTATVLAAMTATMVSCSDDNNDNVDNTLILVLNNDKISMSPETKAWSNCYVESAENDLTFAAFQFSHSANEQWQSWYGFCPTQSTDNGDHPDDGIAHQWGSIAGRGLFRDMPYLLCFWDSYNEMDAFDTVEEPSLRISLKDDNYDGFYPQAVALTNSAYGYYAIKNGTAFNRAFTANDKFSVVIIGTYRGMQTGVVRFTLAEGTNILKEWKDCDLRPLGKVDEIYFRMESTDSGEWGINNPTYFCMDYFRLKFVKD